MASDSDDDAPVWQLAQPDAEWHSDSSEETPIWKLATNLKPPPPPPRPRAHANSVVANAAGGRAASKKHPHSTPAQAEQSCIASVPKKNVVKAKQVPAPSSRATSSGKSSKKPLNDAASKPKKKKSIEASVADGTSTFSDAESAGAFAAVKQMGKKKQTIGRVDTSDSDTGREDDGESTAKLATSKQASKKLETSHEAASSGNESSGSEDEPVGKLAAASTQSGRKQKVRGINASSGDLSEESDDEPAESVDARKQTGATQKPSRIHVSDDEASDKSEDDQESKKARKRQKSDLAKASDSDGSEDEPVGKLASSKQLATNQNASCRKDSDDDISSDDGMNTDGALSDASEYLPDDKAKRTAKKKRAAYSSDDNSSSFGSDASDYSMLRRRKGSKGKTKHKHHTCEFDDNNPVDWKRALQLKDKFSNAPRKYVEAARLGSGSFLVIGNLRSRSTWKLPFRDHAGKVNLQLLKDARKVVLTGMTRAKRKVHFVIPPKVKSTVEQLWTDAKLWYKAYGRGLPSKGTAEVDHAQGEPKGRAKGAEERPAEKNAPPPKKSEDDDELQTLESLMQAQKQHPAVGEEAASEDEGSSDGEIPPAKENFDGAVEGDEEDDELAYLKEVQADQQQRQVKERFWRRDADFIDDGDESEEAQSDSDADEALEERQRSKLPLEVDFRLDQQQVYDMLHSESQRLLRKQQSVLPCRMEKAVHLGDLLHKIEQRKASKRTVVPPAEKEETGPVSAASCSECHSVLDEDCVPVIERRPNACGPQRVFCSQLCLAMSQSRDCAVLSGRPAPTASTSGKKAEVDDDEDNDMLVVLAPVNHEEKKMKLARALSNVGRDVASVAKQREQLRRKLHGSATDQKRETARTSGKYEFIELDETPPNDDDEANDLEDDQDDPEGDEEPAGERCADMLDSTPESPRAVEATDSSHQARNVNVVSEVGASVVHPHILSADAEEPSNDMSAKLDETISCEQHAASNNCSSQDLCEGTSEAQTDPINNGGPVVDVAENGSAVSHDMGIGDTDERMSEDLGESDEESLDEGDPKEKVKKASGKAKRKAKCDALNDRKDERKASRVRLEGYEDEDEDSLDDFIADSDDEEEDDIAPAAEEGEGEEEDIVAQTIRNKLGSDWVVGDKSCPNLSDDDGEEETRISALREKLRSKLKRTRSKENTETDAPTASNSSILFPTWDEKSLSVWSLRGDNSSAPHQSIKRQASAPATTHNNSSSTSLPKPRIARIGSFNVARQGMSANSNLLNRLSNGSGGSTSFSKTFVFAQLGDDNTTNADRSTFAVERQASSVASSSVSAKFKEKSKVQEGFPHAKSPNETAKKVSAPSFLATVLSKSKHFSKPASARPNCSA